MKFWDASALVPQLVPEFATKRLQSLAAGDSEMLVWWGSEVECALAACLERATALDLEAALRAFDRLKQLADCWHEVKSNGVVRETATRFLRVPPVAGRRCALARGRLGCRGTPSGLAPTDHAR